MSISASPSQITTKFVSIYSKLFQGQTVEQINPSIDSGAFFSDLLALDINRTYLEGALTSLSKDACLRGHRNLLNELFHWCLTWARNATYEDPRKAHALETLSIVVKTILGKNLSGWEVMEILAGGVAQSDVIFMDMVTTIDTLLVTEDAPADLRHKALQLALTFMCGTNQLSPGAYFLRKDLFPSISQFIKSSETSQFTFEAVLLLGVLANYHKSDSAKLNPYLKWIKETEDEDLMRNICWACSYALVGSIRSYQSIADESNSTGFKISIGSVWSALRPDRMLAPVFNDPSPRVLYKSQPIEGTVVLLPLFEFMRMNGVFSKVLIGYVTSDKVSNNPPLYTMISLNSYLLTHATSTFSPRALAYANLSLHLSLSMVENNDIMEALSKPIDFEIRLCRQRLPLLPTSPLPRSPLCSILDCCALWLRHNLHKRLEVASYTLCIWICYRVIWYLQHQRIRFTYEWNELWSSLLGLLHFLATRLGDLHTTGGIGQLLSETIILLDLVISTAEIYLNTPQAIHQLVYELVRSGETVRKLEATVKSLAAPTSEDPSTEHANEILADILVMVAYYESKTQGGARSANHFMQVIAKEVDADGIHGIHPGREFEVRKRTEDILVFSRFACSDGLALMP